METLDASRVTAALLALSTVPSVLSADKLLEHPALLFALYGSDALKGREQPRARAAELVGQLRRIADAREDQRALGLAHVLLVTRNWMDGLGVGDRVEAAHVRGGYSSRTWGAKRLSEARGVADHLAKWWQDIGNDDASRYTRLSSHAELMYRAHELASYVENTCASIQGLRAIADIARNLEGPDDLTGPLGRLLLKDPHNDWFIFYNIVEASVNELYFRPYRERNFLLSERIHGLLWSFFEEFGDGYTWWAYVPQYFLKHGPVHRDDVGDFVSRDRHLARAYNRVQRACFGDDVTEQFFPDLQVGPGFNGGLDPYSAGLALEQAFAAYLDRGPIAHSSGDLRAHSRIGQIYDGLTLAEREALVAALERLEARDPGQWQRALKIARLGSPPPKG